jgi:hypothetical protein
MKSKAGILVMHVASVLGVGLVALWVVAHLLYLGPVQAVTEAVMAWLAGLTALSAVIASVTLLGCGLIQGGTSSAWLRFVALARSVTAVVGAALVIVGLLHYRDTEPRGDLAWLAAGGAILAAALLVHAWLAVAERRHLS